MSWGYYGWRPYVPVAERRAKAARELAKLAKKSGHAASPVVLDGRKIASTFWGKAWCDNLEAYSDYANRLPARAHLCSQRFGRGFADWQRQSDRPGLRVELYKIEIKIKPLAPSLWKSIQTECAGKIDSLIELLQGKLSSAVMQIVTRRERGLFPTPKEIDLDCSCPDWADLCKHVAASLYGVGAKLDQNPSTAFPAAGRGPLRLDQQSVRCRSRAPDHRDGGRRSSDERSRSGGCLRHRIGAAIRLIPRPRLTFPLRRRRFRRRRQRRHPGAWPNGSKKSRTD